jgi:hypothetical protein
MLGYSLKADFDAAAYVLRDCALLLRTALSMWVHTWLQIATPAILLITIYEEQYSVWQLGKLHVSTSRPLPQPIIRLK